MTITYADGSQESGRGRLLRILPLLMCSRCGGSLSDHEQFLACQNCGVHHQVKGFVAILLPAGVQDPGAVVISESDRVSRHPYSARAEDIIARHSDGWVLDLGAGGKFERRRNVVQIDIFRYPSVDVVGSADCLPFGDNSFDAVISQAVFEHLQYPEWAVSEVRRVLKPGGIAKIDTAFLQPEHGYPHHFYNATETGLLHWFRDFKIEWSGVEPFQHPKWAMHWFLGVYLDSVGAAEAQVLRNLPVGDLVDVLQRHATGQTSVVDLKITNALDAVPDHMLRVIAAGVSVHAINPPKHDVTGDMNRLQSPPSLDREREMAQLRAEMLVLAKTAVDLRERLKVAQDKADYLTQFYPQASEVVQFTTDWINPQRSALNTVVATTDLTERSIRPFASLVMRPSAIAPLLETFFSLTNQKFGGWELILVTHKDLAVGARRAVEALCRLDSRVSTVDVTIVSGHNLSSCAALRGEYWMRLPEGTTLSSNAIEEVVTLARNLPGVHRITFDFDRVDQNVPEAMRCYTYEATEFLHEGEFDCSFLRCQRDAQSINLTTNSQETAHIHRSLIHLHASMPDEKAPVKASLTYLTEQHHEITTALQHEIAQQKQLIAALRQAMPSSGIQMGFFRFIRHLIAAKLHRHLPSSVWNVVFRLVLFFEGRSKHKIEKSKPSPFFSIMLEPNSAGELKKTFFSLVHQSYAGWELLLSEKKDQNQEVRAAMRELRHLDERVVVVGKDEPVTEKLRGQYCLQLVDGVTLAPKALEEAVTLAQSRPGTDCIACDFDVMVGDDRDPMRCYNQGVSGMPVSPIDCQAFSAQFVLSKTYQTGRGPPKEFKNSAHIPKSLFYQSATRGPLRQPR